jgi:hypothetical protein
MGILKNKMDTITYYIKAIFLWNIVMLLIVICVCATVASAQDTVDEEISGKVMIAPRDCVFHGQTTHPHTGPRFQYAITKDGDPTIIDLETDQDLRDLKPGQRIKVKGRRLGHDRIKVKELTRGPKKSVSDESEQTVQSAAADSDIGEKTSASDDPVVANATITKTVLVVRVIAADTNTTKTVSELSDDVFGTYGDAKNLVTRYNTVSYGQRLFTPAVGTHIVDGVVEVTIPNTVAGTSDSTIKNAVLTAGQSLFGVPLSDVADHVMLALPPGTAGDWVAYAYMDDYLSVYNDTWISSVSAQAHEVGHNLNMGHSSEGADVYGDMQGYMGPSFPNDDAPDMGFNAAKSWQMAWYSDRSVERNSGQGWSGKLIGFANYGDASADQNVLLKIECGTDDLYVTYNRKTGMNKATQEAGDMVSVVQAADPGSRSFLLAKISLGGVGTVDIPGQPGEQVDIRFDSIGTTGVVQYANVVVGSLSAPSALFADAISGFEIALSWGDNSTNETGFSVERSGTSGSNFVEVAAAAPDSTNYVDASCVPGVTYYYRVFATNASEKSEGSPETSATAPYATSSHSIPYTWLSDVGITNEFTAAVTNDPDGDGFTTAEEYWSGTDPFSAASYLHISTVAFSGGNVQLGWYHDRVDSNIPPLRVQVRTNLFHGSWQNAEANTNAPMSGLNSWETLHTGPRFYRLIVPSMDD